MCQSFGINRTEPSWFTLYFRSRSLNARQCGRRSKTIQSYTGLSPRTLTIPILLTSMTSSVVTNLRHTCAPMTLPDAVCCRLARLLLGCPLTGCSIPSSCHHCHQVISSSAPPPYNSNRDIAVATI